MFQCCFFVFLVFYDPFFPIRRMLTHPLIVSPRLLFAVDFLEPGSRRQVILDMLPESPVRKGLKPLAGSYSVAQYPDLKVGALNHVLQSAAKNSIQYLRSFQPGRYSIVFRDLPARRRTLCLGGPARTTACLTMPLGRVVHSSGVTWWRFLFRHEGKKFH